MVKTGTRSAFSLALAAALVAACLTSDDAESTDHYDLIITDARIIDGTGNPWYRGDIGLRGKRIAAIGDLSEADADHTIDAGEKTATPGFIDLHSHASWSFLSETSLGSMTAAEVFP